MADMYFENLPSTNTPINADNLNKLNDIKVSVTEPTTGEKVWMKHSSNLFDKTKVTPNVSISSTTGNAYGDSNSFATDYIDISGIKNICWNGSSNSGGSSWGAFYNKRKTYLEGFSFENKTIAITNSNAKYVRLGFLNTYLNNLMIQSGTQVKKYEPYEKKEIYIKNDNNVYEKFDNTAIVDNASNGYMQIGNFKIAWGIQAYTTGTTATGGYYNAEFSIILPISFTSGRPFLQPTSGNTERKIFIRPSSATVSGTTLSGIVMTDSSNYSQGFSWFVIGT